MSRSFTPDKVLKSAFDKKASEDGIKFTNWSRFAEDWIAGWSTGFNFMPGYTGHIPGYKSEALYGESFTKETKKAISFNSSWERINKI